MIVIININTIAGFSIPPPGINPSVETLKSIYTKLSFIVNKNNWNLVFNGLINKNSQSKKVVVFASHQKGCETEIRGYLMRVIGLTEKIADKIMIELDQGNKDAHISGILSRRALSHEKILLIDDVQNSMPNMTFMNQISSDLQGDYFKKIFDYLGTTASETQRCVSKKPKKTGKKWTRTRTEKKKETIARNKRDSFKKQKNSSFKLLSKTIQPQIDAVHNDSHMDLSSSLPEEHNQNASKPTLLPQYSNVFFPPASIVPSDLNTTSYRSNNSSEQEKAEPAPMMRTELSREQLGTIFSGFYNKETDGFYLPALTIKN
jgi:hypothetical protein